MCKRLINLEARHRPPARAGRECWDDLAAGPARAWRMAGLAGKAMAPTRLASSACSAAKAQDKSLERKQGFGRGSQRLELVVWGMAFEQTSASLGLLIPKPHIPSLPKKLPSG